MTLKHYNECVNLYSDRLVRFVYANTRDRELANDVVQDTFEKLWTHLRDLRFKTVRTYLFSTANNIMINYLARENKYNPEAPASMPESSHSDQYSDLKEILMQAMNLLPPLQKTALLLREYEHFDYEEIAEMTGESKNTIKQHIFRAKQTLQKYLVSPDNVL
jgi:RNA polymerase sigma factor (sigma-70 family)